VTSSRRLCVEWACLGPGLRLARRVAIEFSSRAIESVEQEWRFCDDKLPNHLLTPPLFNAHTHPMDRAWAGYGLGIGISKLVSPRGGIKYRLLRRALDEDPHVLERALETFSLECIRCGVVAVVAVAEMGDEGAELVRIPSIVAPQPPPSEIGDVESYLKLLRKWRALAMNTALDLEPSELEVVAREAGRVGAYVQVHVSETRRLYESRDFELVRKPMISVHLTHLAKDELLNHATRVRGIIACPRSNALLVSKQPSYKALEELASRGYPAGLGTDNAAWQDPDTLSEASHLARHGMNPWRALYLATVGSARAMGISYVGIEMGSIPLALVIEAPLAQNPIAAALLRLGPRSLVAGTRIVDIQRCGREEAEDVARLAGALLYK